MLAGATIAKCKCQPCRLVYICVLPCKSGSCGESLCTLSLISMQSAYICKCLQGQLSICRLHLSMLAGATIRLQFTSVNRTPGPRPGPRPAPTRAKARPSSLSPGPRPGPRPAPTRAKARPSSPQPGPRPGQPPPGPRPGPARSHPGQGPAAVPGVLCHRASCG